MKSERKHEALQEKGREKGGKDTKGLKRIPQEALKARADILFN